MPPGKYVVGLENEQYHIVRNLRVDITTGKETEQTFGFGILTTKLDPWARVRVDGKDIGLWDEAGIPEGTHIDLVQEPRRQQGENRGADDQRRRAGQA